MSLPSRPDFQQQGPSGNCVIDGKALGWLSCSAYAMAMLIDRSTLGVKQPSGCAVRRGTGDTVGGLTLPQVADVAVIAYRTPIEMHVGSNVASPIYLARQLRAGRGAVVQGNTSATIRTKFRSTGTGINHAIFVNETRGGVTDKPAEALVYDPAADGRGTGWGTADQAPSWWPWTLVLAFAAALRPWGDTDSRTLGPGKVYCALGMDTEPHYHGRYGGTRTKPFPDRTRANLKTVNVHSRPVTHGSTVVGKLNKGDLFVAYQKTSRGEEFRGSTVWYGTHDGDRWVHESRLDHKGGLT